MSAVQDDAVQLLSGLLAHMKQIVGDGASYAMLHYGAVEEGKRIGTGYAEQDLPRILERLDAMMGQRTEIVKDDGSSITLRVNTSALLKTGHRSMQGVVIGLFEGSLASSRHGRFKGQVVQPASKDELVIELKREG